MVGLALVVFQNGVGRGDPGAGSGPPGSFLWRIETEPASYFFGTIHVPFTRVWDAVPANALSAFAGADRVYFELDLTSQKTLADLSACQLLPGGRHLSQVIPLELYFRIRIHLEHVRKAVAGWITEDQRRLNLDPDYLFSRITANWERKRPIWVVLMISSLTKSDVASRGIPVLDLKLSQLASQSRKFIGAIEQVEEQCRPLNALNASQVIFALNQTLIQAEDARLGLKKPDFSTDELIRLYRSGNLDSGYFNRDAVLFPMLSSGSETAQQIDEYFKEKMIIERNQRMAARVIDLLVNHKGHSYFFAFGAGHFIGDDTVLDLVRSAGFSIKHILPDQPLSNERFPTSLKPGKTTVVQGTFDDLSQEEKTKAFLKFLQYRQQQEQKQGTNKFKELVKSSKSANELDLDRSDDRNEVFSEMDEKAVEESLRIWYGLSSSSKCSSTWQLSVFSSVVYWFVYLHHLR